MPSCANKKLLTDILRNEWNFTGYVISDDDAISQLITAHKYIEDGVDAVAECIKAGCNVELTDQQFIYYNMVCDAGKRVGVGGEAEKGRRDVGRW